ncbi:MAG: hypothetical protein ABSG03_01795 [Bryobacteraceae bacterium]|jgi:hypothetical protein
MYPEFLLPETTVRDAGTSPAIDLREERGGMLFLTLGITRIVEKESIEISIWGSADGVDWGRVPLLAYPQKFYCGVYQMPVDLTRRPDVKYLRAGWEVSRWSGVPGQPLFTVYLLLETTDRQLAAASA